MKTTLQFRPISLTDCQQVRQHVYTMECRNCDLNFMNLMSWRFLFKTELAFHDDWLVLRFLSEGKLAYLPPVGEGEWDGILSLMMEDAAAQGQPLRLMGVCESSKEHLLTTKPGFFEVTQDRAFTDYMYRRETLASLAGKKLQSKRNHINRFTRLYPDYQFLPLDASLFDACLSLLKKWNSQKLENEEGRLSVDEEERSLRFTFEHWEDLGGIGGVLMVADKIIAFTYGAPINYDTFDVCVEKADIVYDGAFTMMNREFARYLPEKYIYINREEDLGIEGLRKAKMSYQPEWLLHKYTLIPKE